MSTNLKTNDTGRIASDLRCDTLALANSIVEFETGQAGTVARIDHADGRREYAGPLDDDTISALREVAE